jgi:hypothetical protein
MQRPRERLVVAEHGSQSQPRAELDPRPGHGRALDRQPHHGLRVPVEHRGRLVRAAHARPREQRPRAQHRRQALLDDPVREVAREVPPRSPHRRPPSRRGRLEQHELARDRLGAQPLGPQAPVEGVEQHTLLRRCAPRREREPLFEQLDRPRRIERRRQDQLDGLRRHAG